MNLKHTAHLPYESDNINRYGKFGLDKYYLNFCVFLLLLMFMFFDDLIYFVEIIFIIYIY